MGWEEGWVRARDQRDELGFTGWLGCEGTPSANEAPEEGAGQCNIPPFLEHIHSKALPLTGLSIIICLTSPMSIY